MQQKGKGKGFVDVTVHVTVLAAVFMHFQCLEFCFTVFRRPLVRPPALSHASGQTDGRNKFADGLLDTD